MISPVIKHVDRAFAAIRNAVAPTSLVPLGYFRFAPFAVAKSGDDVEKICADSGKAENCRAVLVGGESLLCQSAVRGGSSHDNGGGNPPNSGGGSTPNIGYGRPCLK